MVSATRRTRTVWLAVAALLGLGVWWLELRGPGSSGGDVGALFAARRSGVFVEVDGRVERTLADDTTGRRHQRFVLELDDGLTLLVSHNVDLAPRVPLVVGDPVEVRGEYEWNELGGVLHWTHHDPAGRRTGGWVRHGGKVYR